MENLFMTLGCLALAISQLFSLKELYHLDRRIQELELLKKAFIKALEEEDKNGQG